jgi:hypothetical protein
LIMLLALGLHVRLARGGLLMFGLGMLLAFSLLLGGLLVLVLAFGILGVLGLDALRLILALLLRLLMFGMLPGLLLFRMDLWRRLVLRLPLMVGSLRLPS